MDSDEPIPFGWFIVHRIEKRGVVLLINKQLYAMQRMQERSSSYSNVAELDYCLALIRHRQQQQQEEEEEEKKKKRRRRIGGDDGDDDFVHRYYGGGGGFPFRFVDWMDTDNSRPRRVQRHADQIRAAFAREPCLVYIKKLLPQEKNITYRNSLFM